jgi:hypothetical protein
MKPSFSEIRIRTRLSKARVESLMAKIPTDDDYDILITGNAKVYKPDGQPLCTVRKGAVKDEMETAYPILTTIRATTENRGYASGTEERVQQGAQRRGIPVTSSLLGAYENSGYYHFCRLTSWTAKELDEKWPSLFPLFRAIGLQFAEYMPDRYAAQMRYAERTPSEWLVGGTPFSTVTCNNSFATGAHRDKGDLAAGFSCLAVARRGDYTGGLLTFPEYRVAVDMADGDLILMDAHGEVHCNTQLRCYCGSGWPKNVGHAATGPCKQCGAERISVVCYFREEMVQCGTQEEERAKHLAWAESVNAGSASNSEDVLV